MDNVLVNTVSDTPLYYINVVSCSQVSFTPCGAGGTCCSSDGIRVVDTPSAATCANQVESSMLTPAVSDRALLDADLERKRRCANQLRYHNLPQLLSQLSWRLPYGR